MLNSKDPKQTQGRVKMLRYLEDLVRNVGFKRTIKRLLKYEKQEFPSGNHRDWTPEQQKRGDYINHELSEIANEYERLKRRCNKLMKTPIYLTKQEIAEGYGLDMNLIWLVETMLADDKEMQKIAMAHADPEMCRYTSRYWEEMYAMNRGDDFLWLRPDRQMEILAFPVSISINRYASKRDVIDYIEKKWKFIESALGEYRDKSLKLKSRKFNQVMIDFIWDNKAIKSQEIVKLLDVKFPKHGLAYYEVSKLIQIEKQRRERNIM